MVDQGRAPKDDNSTLAPEILSVPALRRGPEAAVEESRQKFLARRAELFVDGICDKGKLENSGGRVLKNPRKPLDDLDDDVLTRIAFQTAMICGYFLVVEKAERLAKDRGSEISARAVSFPEYIATLNELFLPGTCRGSRLCFARSSLTWRATRRRAACHLVTGFDSGGPVKRYQFRAAES